MSRLWAGRLAFIPDRGIEGIFFLLATGSGAHPASYPVGTCGSLPGGKVAGREADHLPPSSVEIKNEWSYTSTPHYFMTRYLVKHRDNFAVIFFV
jgi:hypothetical protein